MVKVNWDWCNRTLDWESSSSCRCSIGRQDSSISDGHWWLSLSLHLSILLQNLVNVFCGLPLGLLLSSGVQFMTTFAGLSTVCLNMTSQSHPLCFRYFQHIRFIPDLLISSSLLTRSVHDIPYIFQIHRRWKTSKVLRINDVNFHVSHAWSAVDNTSEV